MSEFRVLSKQIIAQHVKRMDIMAPDIARSARPGQFVLVMADAFSLRLPLPIVETNSQKETIAIVFSEENPAWQKIGGLPIGHNLEVVMGPLGNPALPKALETSVCIGHELGIAHIVPISRYLQKHGSKNFSILGAATKRSLLMESQMRLSSHSIFVMSEDGSVGRKGFVTDALSDVLARYPVEQIFIAAPSKIIHEVLNIACKKKIKVNAVLAPLALSGIGLCGSDRIKIDDGYASFSANGPIFDARQVDLNFYEERFMRSYG